LQTCNLSYREVYGKLPKRVVFSSSVIGESAPVKTTKKGASPSNQRKVTEEQN